MEKYKKHLNGVIEQTDFFNKICEYKREYSEKYNNYGIKGELLSNIRLGFLLGSIGKIPNSIVDVGYGNGDFLKVASKCITKCFGNDISDYPTPPGIEKISWEKLLNNNYDVITFFDSLEHIPDINFIKDLKCNYIFITLPWCHNYNDEWFLNWKHRRPDEHLWHFNEESLINFFNEMGYDCINSGVAFEDIIRKDDRYNPNILTGIFKKKNIYEN
jgi:hypothetical protein